MIDIFGLVAAAVAFFIVAAAPGPAVLALITVSLAQGRRSGMHFGFGLTIGLAFWGLVAATGLGAVLQASSHALTVLKVLGGAYLIWLAYGSAKSAQGPAPQAAQVTASGAWFRRGLLLNLSNPKAVLAWMATLTLGMPEGHNTAQVAALTVLCVVLGQLIYSAYALVFSTHHAMKAYARARRWVDGLVAVFFAAAGLGLIRSAFSR